MKKEVTLINFNTQNLYSTEKKINFKKKITIKNKVYEKNKKIKSKKLKVLGNFFKLKYKKKKKLIKFNLCLAHKIYILKNVNNFSCFKKIKKNKLIFLEKNKTIKSRSSKLSNLSFFFLNSILKLALCCCLPMGFYNGKK